MLIDWFTVGAQIVNFLILVWLLKRFLYGPIVKAMRTRSERIAREVNEAKAARREAEDKEKRLSQERAELQAERERLMEQAKADVRAWREEATERARREVDENRSSWLEGLRREQERTGDMLKRRIAAQVLAVSRAVLADLADESLDAKVAERFVEQLKRQKNEGGPGFGHSGEVRLQSGHELPDDVRERLREEVSRLFPEADKVTVGSNGDLGLGLSLVAGDRKWDLNLSSYLQGLEQDILIGLQPGRRDERGQGRGGGQGREAANGSRESQASQAEAS